MSVHSHSRIWLHLIWTTFRRRPVIHKPAAIALSRHLHEYAAALDIHMSINFANPEHVHALIDLPTRYAVEDVMRRIKGASSHWLNESALIDGRFRWGRGYGVFSVSHSQHHRVARYIANQEEHHRRKRLDDELRGFVRRCGLEWRDDAWH